MAITPSIDDKERTMADASNRKSATSNDIAEVSAAEVTTEHRRQPAVIRLGKATDLLQGGYGGYYDCSPNSQSQNGCR